MSDTGWISLHREIMEDDFWFKDPFTRAQAWIDILLITNYQDSEFYVRDNPVTVKRGQFAYAERTLAKRWKWSQTKVRTFLKLLEKDGKIESQKNNILSCYTVLNYNKYQKETEKRSTGKAQEKHRKSNNNNINNNNKSSNINITTTDVKKISLNKEKTFGYPSINEGITILKSLTGQVMNERLNRYALLRLYKKHGKELTFKAITFAWKSREEEFCPSITNYIELERKWPNLESFGRRLRKKIAEEKEKQQKEIPVISDIEEARRKGIVW